jgi:hypothetical protein
MKEEANKRLKCTFFFLMVFTKTQSKIDQDSSQDKHTQHRGSKAIIIRTRQSLTNSIRSPVEGRQGIDHHHHGDECEHSGRDTTDPVSKVEEANGEGSEEDGKVEPREEGTFVGEEDLGLDSHGERNTFAWGGLEEGLG